VDVNESPARLPVPLPLVEVHRADTSEGENPGRCIDAPGPGTRSCQRCVGIGTLADLPRAAEGGMRDGIEVDLEHDLERSRCARLDGLEHAFAHRGLIETTSEGSERVRPRPRIGEDSRCDPADGVGRAVSLKHDGFARTWRSQNGTRRDYSCEEDEAPSDERNQKPSHDPSHRRRAGCQHARLPAGCQDDRERGEGRRDSPMARASVEQQDLKPRVLVLPAFLLLTVAPVLLTTVRSIS